MDSGRAHSLMAQWGQWLLFTGAVVRGVTAIYALLAANQFLNAVNQITQDAATTADERWTWLAAIIVSVLVATSILGFLAWHQARKGDARRGGILGIILGVVSLVDPFFLIGGILVLVSDKKGEDADLGEVVVSKPSS